MLQMMSILKSPRSVKKPAKEGIRIGEICSRKKRIYF
jgi:hypothetical protein